MSSPNASASSSILRKGIVATSDQGSDTLVADIATDPEVQVIEEQSENGNDTLNITVGALVEVMSVAIQGVMVEVLSVDVIEDNETMTITIEKIAKGKTDENGQICFELKQGNYVVVATYDRLKGVGKCNMEEDVDTDILLHNWSRDCNHSRKNMVKTYTHMERMTIQIDPEREPMMEIPPEGMPFMEIPPEGESVWE